MASVHMRVNRLMASVLVDVDGIVGIVRMNGHAGVFM